jgi:hypothetical protein
MRVFRWVLTIVFGALLVADGIVAFRLSLYGWPNRLVIGTMDSAIHVRVVPIPMNESAWVSVAVYVLSHIVLGYGVWRLWRTRRGT